MGLPDVVIDGTVIETDPPRKLVHTYRFLFSDAMKSEGFTRVTWEIEKAAAGFSRLTVTHELEGAPIMAGMVSSKFSELGTGGWSWILSDMKSLLETGSTREIAHRSGRRFSLASVRSNETQIGTDCFEF